MREFFKKAILKEGLKESWKAGGKVIAIALVALCVVALSGNAAVAATAKKSMGKLEECDPAVKGNLLEGIGKAHKAYTEQTVLVGTKEMRQFGPENIRDGYCFKNIDNYLSKASKYRKYLNMDADQIFAKIGEAAGKFALQQISNLANAACEYAAVTVNNVVDKVCIPIPDLTRPEFPLHSADREYCDGLSPTDVFGEVENSPLTELPGVGELPTPDGSSKLYMYPGYISRGLVDSTSGDPRL